MERNPLCIQTLLEADVRPELIDIKLLESRRSVLSMFIPPCLVQSCHLINTQKIFTDQMNRWVKMTISIFGNSEGVIADHP